MIVYNDVNNDVILVVYSDCLHYHKVVDEGQLTKNLQIPMDSKVSRIGFHDETRHW